jgi:hypothetical protein
VPILYVHGVNVRDRTRFEHVKSMLRQWVCPALGTRPDAVTIDDAFWGDLGVKLAWGGVSRPRSRILGMGTPGDVTTRQRGGVVASLDGALPAGGDVARPTGVVGGFGAVGRAMPRPSSLEPDALADMLLDWIPDEMSAPPTRALAAARVMEVAHDAALRVRLRGCADATAELELLGDTLTMPPSGDAVAGVVAMGSGSLLQRWKARIVEGWSRLDDLPAYAASAALLEARKWAHGAVSNLVGDVVAYVLSRQGGGPGPIAQRVLDKIDELHAKRTPDDDALVVLTHSMGGQIVFDVVSRWLPARPAAGRPRVDFWCATASQVGFFEEAKFLLTSDANVGAPQRAAFPDAALGRWWNVWDPNDVLSFTAGAIFDGVDDEAYDSGMPLTRAHGGYLDYPSFYRRFADKLRAAKAAGWRR